MNFLEAFNILDEIYKTDFNNGRDDLFYHFYSDLADLLNSLHTNRIYSNKNVRAAQIDIFSVKENQAYVCMTIGREGKERVVKHYQRPLGISFTDLSSTCDRQGFIFDPNKYYNQVAAKTQYSGSAVDEATHVKTDDEKRAKADQTKINKMINAFRDFRITAIGKLSDGRCFVSGGAGRSLTGHLHSKLFEDDGKPDGLYQQLRNWFITNMSSPDERYKYYHFTNNNIGSLDDPEAQIYDGKLINSSANLNKYYIPWEDKKSDKDTDTDTKTYKQAVAFAGPGSKAINKVGFDEIYGVGPLQVEDESGDILLRFELAGGSGGKGGYSPARVFGLSTKTDDYADASHIQKSVSSTTLHLVMDKELANKLYALYDESEYRVYIPDKKDFTFTAQDVSSIVLPQIYQANGADEALHLDVLVDIIEHNAQYTLSSKKSDAVKQLIADGVLESSGKQTMTDITYDVVKELIALLTGKYRDVTVEIIPDHSSVSTTRITAYNKNHNDITKFPKSGKAPGNNKSRYLVTGDWPDMSRAEAVSWKGIPSIVAPVLIDNDTAEGAEVMARCGAETVLIGHDKENNKYVLFIDNAHKTDGFFELPGGGLYSKASGPASYRQLAKHRLEFKAGIKSIKPQPKKNSEEDPNATTMSQTDMFSDTGYGLLLNEVGVAKDDEVKWPFSYYRLFTARYIPVISEENLDFSHDNRSQASAMKVSGENGYVAFARWIPVETLSINNIINARYSNIIPLIQHVANKFTWNDSNKNLEDDSDDEQLDIE